MATNQYKAWCAHCKAEIPPGEGVLRGKDDNNRWIVEHVTCPPSAAKRVEQAQQNPVNQKRTPGQPKGVKKIASKPEFPPTDEQQAIIDAFRTKQSLVAEAGAGTGKTSTLRFLALDAQERGLKGLYTAFNRKLVDETEETMPANVLCRNVHRLAYHAVIPGTPFAQRLKESARVPAKEVARRLRTQDLKVGSYDIDRVRVAALVMLTISEFCKTGDRQITIKHCPYVEGIDEPVGGKRTYTNNRRLAKKIAPVASRAWEDIVNPEGVLPFKPEHYLKIWQLSNPVLDFDFILFDESQDANPVMAAVIDAQTCQRVYVGDAQQAIYEFTGAVNSIQVQKDLGLPVFQLTKSFRFGPAIADAANKILDEIEGAELRIVGFDKIESTVGSHTEFDAILTRTNAAGIACLLTAQEEGVAAHLIGGSDEFVKLVKAAQTLQDGKTTTHPELIAFKTWDEVVKYSKEDEGADLRLFVRLVEQYGTHAIIHALENQPQEKDAKLVISTAHKSKGREWNRVRIADDFVKPVKPGEEPTPPSASELRLRYVAVTRAKQHLDATALDGGRSAGVAEYDAQNAAEEA